ncbi:MULTISPECIES: hypothetical protein [Streptomyces]|uniref:Uncharacterized protein n=1 Tax=Streptomyces dengpaensis TaxID=2049881 RepID=A0ABM6T0S2_9ACTN|nr:MULTISPECIES: hypothetical protein [Streptomyces]AVH60589.1 hypothetical protein C4B68_37875 [Streptomyces dengpaensis]PIB04436.1 hypothetical protein B1C81_33075 [Streptomyces sp. HG99]
MNSYNSPAPQRPADARPLHRRKRVWAAGLALFAAGAIGGTQSANDNATAAQALASKPTPTVTVTASAAQSAASPSPAPTVTKTTTVRTPGPTVTVTVTKAAQAAGSGTSSGDDTSTGTCSIVSNAGNCYQAGQYCRKSDHGARTTTASGARIKCSYSSNAWRWTYS